MSVGRSEFNREAFAHLPEAAKKESKRIEIEIQTLTKSLSTLQQEAERGVAARTKSKKININVQKNAIIAEIDSLKERLQEIYKSK
ncbi:MAG: hypothetical protein LLF94_12080 [Chlamydiales bacterium]|nr:hypothetical protein [Chlamydiales bacterium]